MALAYLLLIAAIALSLQKNRAWVYSVLWVDFVLVIWIFVRHITIYLGLNI